jgi:hypothetical protein
MPFQNFTSLDSAAKNATASPGKKGMWDRLAGGQSGRLGTDRRVCLEGNKQNSVFCYELSRNVIENKWGLWQWSRLLLRCH